MSTSTIDPDKAWHCQFCKKPLPFDTRILRKDSCPHCRSDLHVCLNCGFYEQSAYNNCLEPVTEPVRDKDRANFCTYFTFRQGGFDENHEADAAKKKLESLFKF